MISTAPRSTTTAAISESFGMIVIAVAESKIRAVEHIHAARRNTVSQYEKFFPG